MKNYKILIIAFLFSLFAQSQKFDKGSIDGPMTTAEIQALASPKLGQTIYNSETKTDWQYDGTDWVDTGSGSSLTDAEVVAAVDAELGQTDWKTGGSTYTFGVGLTDTNGNVTLDNPFTTADENSIAANTAKVSYPGDASITITESQISDLTHTVDTNTQLSNAQVVAAVLAEEPSVDFDSTDDVNLGGNQLITGTKSYSAITEHFRLRPYNDTDSRVGDSNNVWTEMYSKQYSIKSSNSSDYDYWINNTANNLSFNLRDLSGTPVTVNYSMNLTGDPVNPQDLADKEYVDTVVGGIGGGTDDQNLSYSAGSISIEDGNSIDLTDANLVSAYAPGNYTPVTSTVRGQFQGIDAALGGLGVGTPDDGSVTLAKLANGAHGIVGYDSGGSPANYAISSAFHSIYSAYSGTSNASPIGTYEVAVRNPNSTSNIEMVPLQAIADLGSGGGTDGMVSDTDGDAGFTIAGFDEIQNFVVGPQAAYDALGSYDDNVFYYIVGLKPATNLASAANTDTTVDLTWTASPDATYVSYYELSIDDGTPTNIGNVTSYTATSLTASTAYNFKVRPSDANGNKGAYTSNVSVTTSAPVPTAIYAGANALDPTNEVDGIANISANTNVSVSSSTTQVDDGTYSIFVDVGTDGNPIDMNLVLQGVTAGQDVTITFMVYRPDGSASNMAGWMRVADGWTSQTGTNIGSLPYDTWRPITLSGVATQNNPSVEIDGSPTGDFYIDNVVITEN